MSQSRSIFTLVLLALLLPSCDKLGGSGGNARSQDGRIQLHLPSGWSEAQLPGSIGKIQAKATFKDAYCSVISESKQDLKHNSIQDYARSILAIEVGKAKLKDRTVSDAKDLKVGDYPAVQYEVRGTVNNINVVYVKTFIETPTRWNQVLCWSTPSKVDNARGDFQAIYESFKELPAGAK